MAVSLRDSAPAVPRRVRSAAAHSVHAPASVLGRGAAESPAFRCRGARLWV